MPLPYPRDDPGQPRPVGVLRVVQANVTRPPFGVNLTHWRADGNDAGSHRVAGDGLASGWMSP